MMDLELANSVTPCFHGAFERSLYGMGYDFNVEDKLFYNLVLSVELQANGEDAKSLTYQAELACGSVCLYCGIVRFSISF